MSYSRSIPDQILSSDNRSILVRPVLKQINKRTLDDRAHRHLFQEIIYIKKGEGSHFIDDRTILLRPRCFYLIGKNQVHGFNYGKDLEGVLIRFNEDFIPASPEGSGLFRDYSNAILLKSELPLSSGEASSFENILSILQTEYTAQHPNKTAVLQNLLLALLAKLNGALLTHMDADLDKIKDKERQLFNKFHLLSNTHFGKEHQLEFYARKLGISIRRLSNICVKFSGKTAKSILLDKVVSEIKRFLKFSELSHKEIAYRLGFNDPAYMARLFKRHTGSTLGTYKKSNKTGIY